MAMPRLPGESGAEAAPRAPRWCSGCGAGVDSAPHTSSCDSTASVSAAHAHHVDRAFHANACNSQRQRALPHCPAPVSVASGASSGACCNMPAAPRGCFQRLVAFVLVIDVGRRIERLLAGAHGRGGAGRRISKRPLLRPEYRSPAGENSCSINSIGRSASGPAVRQAAAFAGRAVQTALQQRQQHIDPNRRGSIFRQQKLRGFRHRRPIVIPGGITSEVLGRSPQFTQV